MPAVIVTTERELESIVMKAVHTALQCVQQNAAKRYLTEDEAAGMLGKTASTMRTMRCRKTGPPYTKDGSRVMYDINDINAYMQKRKVKTKSDLHA